MRVAALFVLILGCQQYAAAAEIYCNTQGRECSDRPSSSINVPRTAAGPSLSANAAAAPTTATPAEGSGDQVEAQRERNAAMAKAQAELAKDLSDKRSAQCKQAQEYYQRLVSATVLNRTDKEGKAVELSAKDASQERLSAKLRMDSTCSQAAAN